MSAGEGAGKLVLGILGSALIALVVMTVFDAILQTGLGPKPGDPLYPAWEGQVNAVSVVLPMLVGWPQLEANISSPHSRPTKTRRNKSTGRFEKAAENAGLQPEVYTNAAGQKQMKVTARVLRHSFAVQSIKNGMDTRTLQKLLGHAKIETTERILGWQKSDVRDAARKYGAGAE